jgi:hypothetical protein
MGNTGSYDVQNEPSSPVEPRVQRDITGRKTYRYGGKTYISSFPKEWLRHLPGTGPVMCENCQYHGSYNGVFIGYCTTCSREYNGERGNGFDNHFRETDPKAVNSATQTYLKEVRLSEIILSDFYDDFEKYEEDEVAMEIISDLSQSMWQAIPAETRLDQRLETIQEELKVPVQEELKVPVQEELKVPVQEELKVPVQEELKVPVQVKRTDSNGAIFVPVPLVPIPPKPKPPRPCKHCGGDHWNRDCNNRKSRVKFDMHASIDQ